MAAGRFRAPYSRSDSTPRVHPSCRVNGNPVPSAPWTRRTNPPNACGGWTDNPARPHILLPSPCRPHVFLLEGWIAAATELLKPVFQPEISIKRWNALWSARGFESLYFHEIMDYGALRGLSYYYMWCLQQSQTQHLEFLWINVQPPFSLTFRPSQVPLRTSMDCGQAVNVDFQLVVDGLFGMEVEAVKTGRI